MTPGIQFFAILGMFVVPAIILGCLLSKMISTRHKERMAMIEKGCAIPDAPSNPYKGLQRGMLILGLGIGAVVGAFVGNMFEQIIPAIFVGSILLFGGIGQVGGSLLARWLSENDEMKGENTSSEQ